VVIEIGMIFNRRYKILGAIGSGGMANVFLAHDLILDRDVAIKVLRTNFQNDPIAVRRFQREAHAASELIHENIVSVYDVGEENGMQYLVMEYVEGMDLKKYIKENFPLDNDRVVDIMRQILSALSLAHEHRIIHRDLKPQNVLVAKDGTCKITDFGIAVALAETSITQTNSLLGSVHYLSPEQARGAMATNRSDIYAMGVMLYELLTGHVPFDGDSAVTIALKHFQEELPSIRLENQSIPQALENVALIAAAKDANNRYASAEEMSRDISTALSPERAKEKRVNFDERMDKTETQVIQPIRPQTKNNVAGIPSQRENTQSLKPVAEEASKQAKKKGSKKKFIIPAVIIVILLGFTAFLLFSPPAEINVPNLSGKTVDDATEMLESRNLQVGDIHEIDDDTIEAGKVVRTNPAAHTNVRSGATIDLFVSSGVEKIALNNYVGQTFSDAQASLRALGFTNNRIRRNDQPSDNVPEGQIISQDTDPGEKVDPTSATVEFTVSSGPSSVTINDYTNQTEDAALADLNNLGIAAARITIVKENSDDVPSGQIIRQTPSGGSSVNLSTGTVVLTVSTGPGQETLPDFRNQTQAQVQSWLDGHGLNGTFTPQASNDVPDGEIISMDPAAGAQVDRGSTVNFIISSGPAQVQVPNIVGNTRAEAEGTLNGLGLKPNATEEYSDTVESGKVIRTNPGQGTQVASGSTVTIVISKGPQNSGN